MPTVVAPLNPLLVGSPPARANLSRFIEATLRTRPFNSILFIHTLTVGLVLG